MTKNLSRQKYKIIFKCLIVIVILPIKSRCVQPPFQLFIPIPLNPLYVHQYDSSPPVSHPHIIYYLYNPSAVGVGLSSDAPTHQFIRNEEEGYQKWVTHDEERDAPARTPIQDSFLFSGTGTNPTQGQCGMKGSLLRSAEVTQRIRTTFELLKDLKSVRESSQGSVLLKNSDFSGPNTADTIFGKYSGNQLILSNKITYGIEAKNKESPWQVAMFIRGKFHCGASLIGERHILTAAHCVSAYKTRPHILEISIGDWDLQSTEDGQNVEAEVKKIKPHSGFNFYDLQNDIAILELKDKVQFNDRIRPICIPPADLEVDDVPITITGWGRNEKNKLQTKLQKLTAFALENTICADRWTRSGAPRSLIGATTLCMDTQFGDSCKGDSGGPAVMEYPSGSGKYVQAGIVSFGSGSCTDFNLPGVYTRVPSYRDWILDNMS